MTEQTKYAFSSEFELGMTLRDWFAGHIIFGMIINRNIIEYDVDDLANSVYKYADELLKNSDKYEEH